jgi:hypothetical protein
LVFGSGDAITTAASSGTSTIVTSSFIRYTITGITVPYEITDLEGNVISGPRVSATTVAITTSVPLVVAFHKNVLHSLHYAGFIISALMTAAGFISDSIPALMSGLGILIITVTSIYELSKE